MVQGSTAAGKGNDGNDSAGAAAMDDPPVPLSWLDRTSPPPKADRRPKREDRRPKKKAKKRQRASKLPPKIDDAVTAWFEYTFAPKTFEEQTWRAEDWWRVHESTFPMIAMLNKHVLATQVCPRVHEHLWLVSARTMGHCTVIVGV